MRVLSGTFAHETSTFTPVVTNWNSYKERVGYLTGHEIFDKFRGSNSIIGGYLDGAETHGFELIPTVCAHAYPSGPTPRDIFDTILNDILERMAAAGEVDGVLLELHGAMVAEGIDDGEGHILAAVRQLVGPNVPILAELDIHANVSQQMVEIADVLIGRKTFPEIDQAERARQCADVLMSIVNEGVRPTMALCPLPMIWGAKQVTEHQPMKEVIDRVYAIESSPGVICASLSASFPLADVPCMGASVYVATDNDLDLAQRHADELGAWIFERRADWHEPKTNTREVLKKLDGNGPFPVIFSDRFDNTGGGSPGDSTSVLLAFIEFGLEDACILNIVDPECAAMCHRAGPGARLELDVGGKSSPMQGEPVHMNAEVVAVSDGRFKYDGPRNAGLEGSLGLSAHIVEAGIHVLLVSIREQPFDTALARSLQLIPQDMRYIGIKSANHYRAAFEPFAGAIYNVTEPSAQNPTTGPITFQNLGRKVYPLDDI
jgi:microcystin degradation protein MlrC